MSAAGQRSATRLLLVTVVVACLYDGAAQLAYNAAVVSGTACPVWPATAVTLIAVLRYGRVAIPGIVIGLVLANLSRPIPVLAVGCILVANALEPFVSVWLLRRWRVDTQLGGPRSILAFVAAIGVGAILSAVGGVGGLWATGVIDASLVPTTAGLWWLGNITGVLCTAPLVLVGPTRGYASRIEGFVVLACAFGVGEVVLNTSHAQVYAVFPILIWAGLRLGQRGAAAVSLVLSAITVADAARGHGPFVQETVTGSLLTSQGFILVIALTTLLLAAITADRRRAALSLVRSERAKRKMADEQAALRRVAEEAARNPEAAPTLELAAREIVQLLDPDVAAVIQFTGPGSVFVHGEWGRQSRVERRSKQIEVVPGGVADKIRSGFSARYDERGGDLTLAPIVQRVGAPILVQDKPWGAVIVGTTSWTTLPPDTEERVERFAGLVSLAVGNAQSRARLTAQATTDPLTGLLNHRAFHERLRDEIARARRHDRSLSVAVFDVDHFKAINDTYGHAAGDRVLIEAARRLREAGRQDEAIGRIGGDELAVIMPEVDGAAANAATDRMRRAIAAGDYPGVGAITASAGVCDLALGGDAEGLLRLADGALYWAKGHGRDVAVEYDAEIVEELSADERADRLARRQALSGVRALARAIDAKDPSTTRHSERVADLARRLAQAAGWTPARVALLHEAALVHDVGKIGVPDAILFKRGALDEAEMAQVRRHAELGAQIASEVLGHEQAAWIRSHHERHDGGGYPEGLRGQQIPEGASLLGIADAWDAMTRARSYSTTMPAEAAWAECLRESGGQFHPDAVAVLGGLWRAGALDDARFARSGRPAALR